MHEFHRQRAVGKATCKASFKQRKNTIKRKWVKTRGPLVQLPRKKARREPKHKVLKPIANIKNFREQPAQTEPIVITKNLLFEYYDELIPVHMDALDLVNNEVYYKLILDKNAGKRAVILKKITKVRKGLTSASTAKHKLTKLIISRISPQSRVHWCQLCHAEKQKCHKWE